jgi:hypothetical protein
MNEKLKEIIMSFDNWVWCNCKDCRIDCHSHAVDTEESKAELVKYVMEKLNEQRS